MLNAIRINLLLPFSRQELRRFFPLFLIYALISFNYGILKVTKDPLIITAPGSGAEVIPFIKLWVVLPMACLTMWCFTLLFNRHSLEKLFYIMTGGFLLFFFLFTFVLYPYHDLLHPHALADRLILSSPKGLHGLIALMRNWTYVLFYVFSELWGVAIMTVLFWGFANSTMQVEEGKKFYGIVGVGANLATILSGSVSLIICSMIKPSHFEQSLQLVTLIVIAVGLLTIWLLRWYYRYVLNGSSQGAHPPQSKEPMNMKNNFRLLLRSPYLLSLACIVIGFYLTLNMVEILWKDQIRTLYPDPLRFQAYQSTIQTVVGVTSTLIGLFFCGRMIRRIGWTRSALITPILMLITALLFFTVVLMQEHPFVRWLSSLFNVTPLALAVFFGSIQQVVARSCKFTLFDTTKEVAYIPLDPSTKIQGKAAIDGVISRLGKSGG
ncbi:MAG: Npt1/Npt2 family nucleotide transporter, partial [Chlamydiota bacterium]|nr:Npt1/Npt2 family nucleotide transporter [Chlamydiota bacterium]